MSNSWAAFGLLVFFTASSMTAEAQVLLRDDFDGTGNVDSTVWRLPFGSEGSFVGRTQYRGDSATDLPQQGIVDASAADGLVTELYLDSYSSIDPGNQFLGTDLLTKRNFALGGGLSFEGRLRLAPTSDALAGTVGGLFLFDVQGDSPAGSGNFFRDEIDFELIGNQTAGAATQDIATNYWNDGDFSNGGDLAFHDVAGLDLTEYQDYRVDWTPNSIKWFVNDNLVRTQTTDVPDDPQKLHINLWAPDSSFSEAFNASLEPTAVLANNQRTTLQVDHVEVSRFNTTVSDNLLTDGSFEVAIAPTDINSVPTTTTGEWLKFSNTFYEFDDISGTDPGLPDAAVDGITMAKMFGPFNGTPDASGLLQNVVASPGQEFEASAWSQTAGGDSIAGSENFTQMSLTFLDASGNVIEEAFADPGNLVPENESTFPLLDGRDPNMPVDTWVQGTASAIAPAGTAFARISLFFIQLNGEGGAAFYDDAQLRLLTADPILGIDGDFNGDGVVDAADYTVYRDNLGLDASALNGNGSGAATVVAADYDLWVANYGNAASTSTSTAVPEPSSLILITAMTILGLRKRVR